MQLYKLAVEIEADDDGFHAVLIDVGDDSVLHVTDSHYRPEDAEADAQRWIDKNA